MGKYISLGAGVDFIAATRIMINKGMANKGKYWIFEKNMGAPVSYFGDLRVLIRASSTRFRLFSIKYN